MNGGHAVSPHDAPVAARLTAGGRGAVSTIRVRGDCRLLDSGEPALFSAANGRPLGDQLPGRIVFGRWGVQAQEDVVICRPDHATVDIHCHGGEAASRRVLRDLKSRGCAVVSWQEMARSAARLLNVECVQALVDASTVRTAGVLLEQQSGLLHAAFESLRIDPRPDLLRQLLQWSNFGLHLVEPWRVVLAGRPNVGKSSLINALVGYSRSIVYDEPGTTRDVVTAETAFDGWPIQLVDTAGIRQGADSLEQAGIARARDQLAAADCRLLLLDISEPQNDDDLRLLGEWPGALIVAHKCDLPNAWHAKMPTAAVKASSVSGEGIDALVTKITERLIPEVPPPGTPVPVLVRQIALLEAALAAIERRDLSGYRNAIEELLA